MDTPPAEDPMFHPVQDGEEPLAEAPELPETPRPITANARTVITWDPRTRFWLILGGVFLLTALYFAATRLSEWAQDRSLVVEGAAVDATIVEIGGATRGQRKPWDSPVRLEFPGPDDKLVSVLGVLQVKTASGLINFGEKVRIRYDRRDPQRWTDRTTPTGIAHALISVYLMTAAAAVTLLVGWVQRGRALATWKTGSLVPAAILSSNSSPIAPGYHYVMAAPGGQNPVGVYVPRNRLTPVRGEILWLLTSPRGSPLAAVAFL